MLVTDKDLTMKAVWTPIIKDKDTGDNIEGNPVEVDTWIMSNKRIYIQSDNKYSAINTKGYILSKSIQIKEGDKLDGVYVVEVDRINDFDGSVDHLEVFTYSGKE